MKWRNSLVFRFWLALNGLVLTGVLTISGLYLWRESVHLENSLKNEGDYSSKYTKFRYWLIYAAGELLTN